MQLTELVRGLTNIEVEPAIAEHVIKATVLLLLAWAISFALRRATASARHLMWMGAVLAVLVLPLVSNTVPAWRLALLPSSVDTHSNLMVPEVSPPTQFEEAAISAPVSASTPTLDLRVAGVKTVNWSQVMFRVWLLGALLLALRLVISAVSAWRLVRRSTTVSDATVLKEVRSACRDLEVRSKVRVVSTARIQMPMAWGFMRQTVLLPATAAEWSRERLRVVLLHELAHLKRHDCETLMLARAVAALHWFNPLVWLAIRRLQSERERACDDLVLAAGTKGTDYAHHLLEIARGVRAGSMGSAMVAMARPSELEGRLLSILDPNRRSRHPFAQPFGLVLVVFLALPLAALKPGVAGQAEAVASLEFERAGAGGMPESEHLAEKSGTGARTFEPKPKRTDGKSQSSEPRTSPPTPELSSNVGSQSQVQSTHVQSIRSQEPQTRPKRGESSGPRSVAAQTASRVNEALVRALGDPQPEQRSRAAHALGMAEATVAVPALVEALADQHARVREQAAWALGMIESDEAVDQLQHSLSDKNAQVRDRSAWALGMIESSVGADALVAALLEDASAGVRERAAWALGMIGSPIGVESLGAAVVRDSAEGVRVRAAWALGMIGDVGGLDSLLTALERDTDSVRQRALWAVGRISG